MNERKKKDQSSPVRRRRIGTAKKDGLFIPTAQVSMLTAGALAIAAFVFWGGYMVGKKHIMEQVVAQVEADSFADQLYSSMCSLYTEYHDNSQMLLAFNDADEEDEESEAEKNREQAEELEAEETAADESDMAGDSFVQYGSGVIDGLAKAESTVYVGQLLSYHVRRYADTFIEKMAKKNIPLEVRTRTSVTASGEAKKWYQVVTKPYSDRQELELVVEQLSQEEKITGAQIIVC